MSQILSMLQLQQQLNDNTNGISWEAGVTKNGKPIDWNRCIYLECSELVESYPWKHWKNIDAKADIDNIKIEVVDIWHFLLSEILRVNSITQKLTPEELSVRICYANNFGLLQSNTKEIDEDYFKQIKCIEDFIKSIFRNEDMTSIVEKYFKVVIQSGLNLETLYKLYIGKNILNRFRQDNGYSDGSYIKMWNGVEDNVVMKEILDNNPVISPEELYDALDIAYKAI
jgi:dimeric dUTPase (all-alpha-NTP-PPase superfamily)